MKRFLLGLFVLLPLTAYQQNNGLARVAQYKTDEVWKFYDGPFVCYVAVNMVLNVGPGISCLKFR